MFFFWQRYARFQRKLHRQRNFFFGIWDFFEIDFFGKSDFDGWVPGEQVRAIVMPRGRPGLMFASTESSWTADCQRGFFLRKPQVPGWPPQELPEKFYPNRKMDFFGNCKKMQKFSAQSALSLPCPTTTPPPQSENRHYWSLDMGVGHSPPCPRKEFFFFLKNSVRWLG